MTARFDIDSPAFKAERKSYYISTITCLVITFVFVAARCFVRLGLQRQFSVDDYLMVAAMATFILEAVFALSSLSHWGHSDIDAEKIRTCLQEPQSCTPPTTKPPTNTPQLFSIAQIMYGFDIMLFKLSIATLQLRVMGLVSSVRYTHYISMGINIIMGFFMFFWALFQCVDYNGIQIPFALPWDHPVCLGRKGVTVGIYVYSCLNVLLDWYYALAMVPMIWKLQQVQRRVKLSACVLLGLGIIASIATIIRFHYIIEFEEAFYGTGDILDNFDKTATWSLIEQAAGICAACLYTFRPLLRLISDHLPSCCWRSKSQHHNGDHDDTGAVLPSWRNTNDIDTQTWRTASTADLRQESVVTRTILSTSTMAQWDVHGGRENSCIELKQKDALSLLSA
ncbi:hypothetical protein HDK90DRAFT_297015 [Phyllosticta capitalensis]|uniref:Rhodopsin domain-containing protein n=1 Tax=Phyllosticta capitalensis TaxID=121624 RepID=A0ABR1YJW3_9PEZI